MGRRPSLLRVLLSLPYNQRCADCQASAEGVITHVDRIAPPPPRCRLTGLFRVFLCASCASLHSKLGLDVEVSATPLSLPRVQPLAGLEDRPNACLPLMRHNSGGNESFLSVLSQLPTVKSSPSDESDDAARLEYVRSVYVERRDRILSLLSRELPTAQSVSPSIPLKVALFLEESKSSPDSVTTLEHFQLREECEHLRGAVQEMELLVQLQQSTVESLSKEYLLQETREEREEREKLLVEREDRIQSLESELQHAQDEVKSLRKAGLDLTAMRTSYRSLQQDYTTCLAVIEGLNKKVERISQFSLSPENNPLLSALESQIRGEISSVFESDFLELQNENAHLVSELSQYEKMDQDYERLESQLKAAVADLERRDGRIASLEAQLSRASASARVAAPTPSSSTVTPQSSSANLGTPTSFRGSSPLSQVMATPKDPEDGDTYFSPKPMTTSPISRSSPSSDPVLSPAVGDLLKHVQDLSEENTMLHTRLNSLPGTAKTKDLVQSLRRENDKLRDRIALQERREMEEYEGFLAHADHSFDDVRHFFNSLEKEIHERGFTDTARGTAFSIDQELDVNLCGILDTLHSKQDVSAMRSAFASLLEAARASEEGGAERVESGLAELDRQMGLCLRDLAEVLVRQERVPLEMRVAELEASLEAAKAELAEAQSQAEHLMTTLSEQEQQNETRLRDVADHLSLRYEEERKDLESTVWVWKQQYQVERKVSKFLYNSVIELKGNIRVFCRIRPFLRGERQSTDMDILISDEEIHHVTHKYTFDSVFDTTVSQEAVFTEVMPYLDSVLAGYNMCIFAYGQTGTGKTYTMEGSEDNRGVYYRTIEYLFDKIHNNASFSYSFSVTVLEVYNENVIDLIQGTRFESKNLNIRSNRDGTIYVEGLTEIPLRTKQDAFQVLRRANSNRSVCAHQLNQTSSRSHLIVTFIVQVNGITSQKKVTSRLNLIDLAGSERIFRTGVQGDMITEALNINKSLSSLGDVISSLGQKSKYIPFRNSKLTFLLHDSLTYNSKVLMFANISPNYSDYEETLSSLNFASRCRETELSPLGKDVPDKIFQRLKQIRSQPSFTDMSTLAPISVFAPSAPSSSLPEDAAGIASASPPPKSTSKSPSASTPHKASSMSSSVSSPPASAAMQTPPPVFESASSAMPPPPRSPALARGSPPGLPVQIPSRGSRTSQPYNAADSM